MNDIPLLDINIENLKIIENLTVSPEILVKHLNKLNISKSAGPDGINSRILKETAEQIAPGLKNLFDKSIKEEKIPTQWKEANVTALFKKGNEKQPNNYRPVSLTSICCKLFERIVRDEIVSNLEAQCLIDKDQHGFTAGRSCTTQLLEVMEL